ncbi:hypothetical protein ABKN59_006947 [Abortiporus biennis]
MAKEDLIDQHVSVKQCKMAVDALLKHVTKVQEKQQEFELLGGREQHVWLTIAVKQMQPEKKLKPHRIPIVHPLVDPRTSSICLITKDPQREYKDLLEKKGVKFVSRVVGIEKLKGKFKPFEARRLLLKENDLFLADARVIPLLPGLLGKKFFDAKKQPIPVDLTKKDLKAELEKAISSTYFHQNQGTCASIKVGTLSQTPAQIIANIKSALPAVVKVIKDGWNNVQNLHIKTSSSASLPIWTCDLGSGEGGRWDGLDADVEMSGSDSEEQSEEEADEDMEDAEEKVELKTGKKGKKRVAEDKEEEEKPKKKARVKGTSEKVVEKVTDKSKTSKADDATPAPATATPANPKSRKSAKESKDASETSVPLPPTPTSAIKATQAPPEDVSGKKKKRKHQTNEDAVPASSVVSPAKPSPTDTPSTPAAAADATQDAERSTKKKRRKSQANVDATPQAIVPSTDAATTEVSSKKKRKSTVADVTGVPSAEIPTPSKDTSQAQPPVTPTPSKKKKARASAVDFFEGDRSENVDTAATPAQSKGAAAPPNTPADGLVGATPATASKKRRKSKGGVEATPVSAAIGKLVDQAETAGDATTTPSSKDNEENTPAKVKKPRHRKRASLAAAEQAVVEATPAKSSQTVSVETPAPAVEGDAEKKKEKRKKRKSAVVAEDQDESSEKPATSVPSTPSVTVEQVKQKKSTTAIEKKKEKVGKAKKSGGESAKEALIGKKGLQH